MDLPKISVIIPLYNAEKYIGDCLESLLVQTFQDFEVIVVDDCSTDNSVAIVQSYAEKFGGRLKIARTKKNSGGGGYVPRNLGLNLSRGEYVIFMDSDDAVTPDALEKLYTTAKKFDADVVGCEKYYDVPEQFWYDTEFRKQLKPST
ncbi:MAG: glycosyltransferase family 2 protein [Selenomonadaceae bacterium]|nr:glycosyltransferase family 2 protein [Selenomonadaceae bacterium]